MPDLADYREALEAVLWQTAYRTHVNGHAALSTSGLSSYEVAFSLLGWEDPHLVAEDATCDAEGCYRWVEAGLKWRDIYLLLCEGHSSHQRRALPVPRLKARALERESRRGPDGVLRYG